MIYPCYAKNYDNDLDFIYETILQNHPGVYNQQDSQFNKNLHQRYAIAKRKFKQSASDAGRKYVINNFVKSFNDPHLWITWKDDKEKKSDHKNSESFGIKNLTDLAAWVSLLTFDLNAKQQKEFDQFLQNIEQLRSKQNIIFDLRKNQGGNSSYGNKIINSLFGQEYANQKRCINNSKIYVDWRASEGNLAHILSLQARVLCT